MVKLKYLLPFFCFSIFLVNISTVEASNFIIMNPQYGHAKIKGESDPHFFFSAKISAKKQTIIKFNQYMCKLIGKDGSSFSDYWFRVGGWSKGLSVEQVAPLSTKTLALTLDNEKTTTWNTSKIGGPKGAIIVEIPKNGFIKFYILWKVTNNFEPVTIQIGDLITIKHNQ